MPVLRRENDSSDNQSSAELLDDLLQCCKSELLSEDSLREIVERHELSLPNNDTPIIPLNDYEFFFGACRNERMTEGIIRCLLEYFPDAASAIERGWSPLHVACWNKMATHSIIQLLVDAAPDSVRSVNNMSMMPLHILCMKRGLDGDATLKILKLLIEKYPEAARHADNDSDLPIHLACVSKSPEFCQVLIDASPGTVRRLNNKGWLPLHALCDKKEVDEVMAMQILNLLMEKYSEAVRHTNNKRNLPIHLAVGTRSLEFCWALLAAYPGSERMSNANGARPFHFACARGTVSTVKYLFNLFPGAIEHATNSGNYPIHFAIRGTIIRDNPVDAVEIVQFLLNCDPNVKLQKHNQVSLLLFACQQNYTGSNIETAIEILKKIYDAHPEAIEDNRIASDMHNFHQQVQAFINGELVHARQAKDLHMMTTRNENGRLPLHTAIQNKVTLGSIKLLVKGNPHAVQSPDNSGALPLHIACQHHNSTNVIRYLVQLDPAILDALDQERNTPLHYACRGAKYDTIALLLEQYDAVSVSKRNAQSKLPIELLWESNEVNDREGVEYTESVFRLLQAYPETIMNFQAKHQAKSGVCSTQNEKKRKLDAV